MRKLTEKEVSKLQGFKGVRGGSQLFFDELMEIYANDGDTIKEIEYCKSIYESISWIESYPAMEKTRHMYYQYMDDLIKKIGYHA